MRLEVRFRHMDRSESLEEMATQKVSAAVEGFIHRHDSHIQVWLVSELNRANRGTPNFICEIEVRYPHKRDFFVSKQSSDMHSALIDAADTLRHLLDEAGKRELTQKRTAAMHAG